MKQMIVLCRREKVNPTSNTACCADVKNFVKMGLKLTSARQAIHRTSSNFLSTAILFCLLTPCQYIHSGEISLKKTDTGYEIALDGQLFARYVTDFNGTPIIWPIIGPTGREMTRAYPMAKTNAEEKQDHPHHRSLWFNHDEVNGNKHWTNSVIAHEKFLKAECDGKTVVLITKNNWLDNKTGATICSDVRTVIFGTLENTRFIDFDITVTAEMETVTFGDTKEGTFALRVPGSMDVDAKKGGKIVNAEGKENADAWAKRSPWVDYSGPVDRKVAGITIMNHPESFRFPTYWHVRTYGLFSANPFGVHDFENLPEKKGELVLKKGESFTLKYRVIFHEGDATSLDLPRLYQMYSAERHEP